ncbi:FAD binding domain-containing protein [Plectosphaerella plurivora]|uniref:FAD binding domain-containing protein n=1 Tax=Plectosphaerella plurivora TaxID=936078 RepID=A0A9P9ACD6_9PEZI|nr:FAD binding domain-containing protein [Plectosphaerella plurivora]
MPETLPAKPVLIIGAGISGLLLAQHLRAQGIPFRLFDRDGDFTTRGVGWGLTLHWSLPALRELLPESLVSRIPTTYVDRRAVEAGEATLFPLHDLATGELVAATPRATEATRIRVTREKLRHLLAEEINVEWGKAFISLRETGQDGDVTAVFEDGSEAVGSLLIACDGGHSRVRRVLFPDRHENYRVPVRVMGFRARYTPEAMAPIKKLDPFFLQATSSKNDTYMYFSVLDAPGNNSPGTDATSHTGDSAPPATGEYTCQVVISWPYRKSFGWGSAPGPLDFPSTPEGTIDLIKAFAETWAEPFKSIARGVSENSELKHLELTDYVPAEGQRTSGRAVLMGDAFHAMTMYRGEGANHAIVDVLEFAQKVSPRLIAGGDGLREALDDYEDGVVKRSRPAVLAARRACLDAHDWTRLNPQSPLLSRREMFMKYDEEA